MSWIVLQRPNRAISQARSSAVLLGLKELMFGKIHPPGTALRHAVGCKCSRYATALDRFPSSTWANGKGRFRSRPGRRAEIAAQYPRVDVIAGVRRPGSCRSPREPTACGCPRHTRRRQTLLFQRLFQVRFGPALLSSSSSRLLAQPQSVGRSRDVKYRDIASSSEARSRPNEDCSAAFSKKRKRTNASRN